MKTRTTKRDRITYLLELLIEERARQTEEVKRLQRQLAVSQAGPILSEDQKDQALDVLRNELRSSLATYRALCRYLAPHIDKIAPIVVEAEGWVRRTVEETVKRNPQ